MAQGAVVGGLDYIAGEIETDAMLDELDDLDPTPVEYRVPPRRYGSAWLFPVIALGLVVWGFAVYGFINLVESLGR